MTFFSLKNRHSFFFSFLSNLGNELFHIIKTSYKSIINKILTWAFSSSSNIGTLLVRGGGGVGGL